jgi:hypothetical protein
MNSHDLDPQRYLTLIEHRDKEIEAKKKQLSKVEIVDGSTLLKTQYPEPRWIWHEILPDAGLCILAASKAAGKTHFLIQLVDAIYRSSPFLGIETTQVKTLFLELELSPRKIKNRLDKMEIVFPKGAPSFAFTWEPGDEGMQLLKQYIEENGIHFVIVDVLQRLWPMRADMNSYQDAYNVLGPIREVAYRLGVLIVLVTHTRKMISIDPLDSILGSVGITANADVILTLARQRGEAEAVLSTYGNDIESQKLALQFKTDPLGFSLSTSQPEEIGLTMEKHAVLETMRKLGGTAKTHQIAVALEKSDQTVSNTLQVLKGKGLLVSGRYGEYSLKNPHVNGVSSVSESQNPEDLHNLHHLHTHI